MSGGGGFAPRIEDRLGILAACCAAMLLPSCSPDTGAPPEVPALAIRSGPIEPPPRVAAGRRDPTNLILISLDTLRADHLSAYGYSRPTSPSIDRFADTAVLFERAYSHAPRTAQSHMSLFTGLYPAEHGVVNFQDGQATRLAEGVPTLATLLSRAGYRTQAYVAGGNLAGSLGFDQGFASYDDAYPADARTKFGRAIRFLESHAAQEPVSRSPFFLFVHTYDIHEPYLAATDEQLRRFVRRDYSDRIVESWQELRELGGEDWEQQMRDFWSRVDRTSPEDIRHLEDMYDACIRSTDEQVGRLLAALERLRLDRDTIVVLLSDHGEEFGDHGGFKHRDLYGECLRVPLIMRFPSTDVTPGLRVSETVRLIDVMPTLLESLGLAVPRHLQGDSLLPLLRGEEQQARPVLAQFALRGFYSLQAGDWKLIGRPPRRRSLGIGPWTVPLPSWTSQHEVYDLALDARESVDLARRHPRLVRRLEEELQRARSQLAANRERLPDRTPVEPDAAVTEQLKALGYLGD